MISTSLDYKKYSKVAVKYLAKYRVPLTLVAIVGILGFSWYRITQLSDPEPSQDVLIEKLAEYKEVDINQEIVEKILKLNDSNVEVNTNFENRDNPFAD